MTSFRRTTTPTLVAVTFGALALGGCLDTANTGSTGPANGPTDTPTQQDVDGGSGDTDGEAADTSPDVPSGPEQPPDMDLELGVGTFELLGANDDGRWVVLSAHWGTDLPDSQASPHDLIRVDTLTGTMDTIASLSHGVSLAGVSHDGRVVAWCQYQVTATLPNGIEAYGEFPHFFNGKDVLGIADLEYSCVTDSPGDFATAVSFLPNRTQWRDGVRAGDTFYFWDAENLYAFSPDGNHVLLAVGQGWRLLADGLLASDAATVNLETGAATGLPVGTLDGDLHVVSADLQHVYASTRDLSISPESVGTLSHIDLASQTPEAALIHSVVRRFYVRATRSGDLLYTMWPEQDPEQLLMQRLSGELVVLSDDFCGYGATTPDHLVINRCNGKRGNLRQVEVIDPVTAAVVYSSTNVSPYGGVPVAGSLALLRGTESSTIVPMGSPDAAEPVPAGLDEASIAVHPARGFPEYWVLTDYGSLMTFSLAEGMQTAAGELEWTSYYSKNVLGRPERLIWLQTGADGATTLKVQGRPPTAL